MSASKRSFLFLQGPCSPLFGQIADRLRDRGHAVHRINFNGGDATYWAPRKATCFRGKLETLPEFLEHIWAKHQITDQVLFGDCRPVHKEAARQGGSFGVRTHVMECGYFRPFWVTLELEGVNGHSLLPKEPDWFRDVGRRLPKNPPAHSFRSSFTKQAAYDVFYHLAGIGNPVFFPHYKTHVPVGIPMEYACYLRRFALHRLYKQQEAQMIGALLNANTPFYLFPLQLNSDAQIIHHSPFHNMPEVIDFVMRSFAKHAPANTQLVIKNHPLDIGLVNYRKLIAKLSQRFELTGRIVYIETGLINSLIKHAVGMVTVNSTSGCAALELDCPTIALSEPIYDLPGLTFQGELDDFWAAYAKPDKSLFRYFRKTVMYSTQINGSLYCEPGSLLAAENAVHVLEAEKTPLEKLL
ncbi:MAG: capsular biosynthesis protein [Methylovulum sp.]|nr:capsular biosynthesis protein [Methylovulum sp.]